MIVRAGFTAPLEQKKLSSTNIKIVELMRFAVAIERACLWIVSKTNLHPDL